MAGQLSFYRKKSALQIKLLYPRFVSGMESKKVLGKPGALLFEMTIGQDRKYDWGNKISLALSETEWPQFLENTEKMRMNGKFELKCIHDKNKGKSNTQDIVTLKIQNGQNKGTYFINLFQGTNKVSVSMSAGELIEIESLIKALIPVMTGMV